MPADLGVLVVHGIGSPLLGEHEAEPRFHRKFERGLRRELAALGISEDEVAFEPCFWHPVLTEVQDRLLARYAGSDLRAGLLRPFVLRNFGDATAYTYRAGGASTVYRDIHARLARALLRLELRVEPGAMLLPVGYSLGCTILSDYFYDRQKPRPALGPDGGEIPLTTFAAGATLAGMVTLGNNMPVFFQTVRFDDPIDLPGPDLTGRVPPVWLNIYDPDDPLGWPLGPLHPSYAALVTDVPVEVGPPVLTATAASHAHYWTDPDVHEPVARLIADLLDRA